MKKEVFISICGGLIFSLSTQTILADEIPSRTLPMSEILKILQTRGYSVIREVEFDDGLYEVEAFDEKGIQLIIRMNPNTGDFINTNLKPRNTPSQCLKRRRELRALAIILFSKLKRTAVSMRQRPLVQRIKN